VHREIKGILPARGRFSIPAAEEKEAVDIDLTKIGDGDGLNKSRTAHFVNCGNYFSDRKNSRDINRTYSLTQINTYTY
jgi:hypothetical protein